MTRVYAGRRGIRLGALSAGQTSALEVLGSRSVSFRTLLDSVRGDDEEISELLRRVREGGWLSVTLTGDGVPLLTFRPLAPAVPPVLELTCDPAELRLSRFAVLRAEQSGMVMESPLAHVAVEFHDATLVSLLASLPGRGPQESSEAVGYGSAVAPTCPAPRSEVVSEVLSALARHGFLTPRDGGAEREFPLAQWSQHELLFHSRTRLGRHDLEYGGTYWAKDIAAPLPAIRRPFGGPTVQLPRPDLDALRTNDRTLTEVLEDRRSLRSHNDSAPLTLAQLGEFLYRGARNRERPGGGPGELGNRPYPSGGAAYELEIYPLITRVDGVVAGLYHYDPEKHRLELLAWPGPALTRLAEAARLSARMPSRPQVTLLVTARFGRVMWKYSAIGYALILKHVGVLYQVMYSVATAMGLAGCALGGGDSDAFAAASGLPWETESTVGEFLLGSTGEEN
ncbi:SagB family peptide dehydrogenase [Streptomyces sp. NBC_01239]|uniref:SagB family peptide dehydrogenase n=1 Tax=Streptomyces sp. NBC_01239 TaxID=2903792 RepID=UPI0022543C31|nr:SagB family peptide dehydrogenase [Streptomyces sp. NBC_01239]MCX4817960.1 SagB family peptide dehydrogenase [Streptomyces sp. NBC_01239]